MIFKGLKAMNFLEKVIFYLLNEEMSLFVGMLLVIHCKNLIKF